MTRKFAIWLLIAAIAAILAWIWHGMATDPPVDVESLIKQHSGESELRESQAESGSVGFRPRKDFSDFVIHSRRWREKLKDEPTPQDQWCYNVLLDGCFPGAEVGKVYVLYGEAKPRNPYRESATKNMKIDKAQPITERLKDRKWEEIR
jgi:hypothetical protein